MRLVYLFSFVFIQAVTLLANDYKEPYFCSIEIKSGDGISVVLNRYGLDVSECNFDKFCELNNIKRGAGLYTHKEYKLPVKIFTYNGRSIRSTINDTDIEKAIRIQKYNEDLLSKGLRSSSYIDSKILWVPYHELECTPDAAVGASKIEKEVVLNGSNSESLFGSKYGKYEVVDRRLEGQVFYLSSGHGGPDPGAMCVDCAATMCEDEYAYDVTLRLARNLMQHAATVHVIIQDRNDGIRDDQYLACDNDEVTLTGRKLPLRQLDRLKQRADAINVLYNKYRKQGVKSQKAVMIHVDSRAKDKNQDVFFYYHDSNIGGKDLAYEVFNTFEAKYNYYRKDKEYKGYVDNRGLYMLRNVRPSSVYVELANIRNSYDHKRLIYDYNRQALANWLFEGVSGIK